MIGWKCPLDNSGVRLQSRRQGSGGNRQLSLLSSPDSGHACGGSSSVGLSKKFLEVSLKRLALALK